MLRRWTIAVLSIFLASPMLKADVNDPATAAATSDNQFATDLFSQVRQSDGNLCISPYSVSSALQMTAAGAAGETATQMLKVLHWTAGADELPAASAALRDQITGPGDAATHPELPAQPQISVANALFSQAGYPYREPFLDLLNHQYAAPLQSVDFAAHPAQACDLINKWAADKTHNRIQKAVPASAISPATRLVLINAIYFKANWQNEFRKSATHDQPFFIGGKDPTPVPTMQQSESFGYMENDQLQTVELPYSGDFSMVILLPKQKDGLAAVEQSLSADSIDGWLKQLSDQTVDVSLPKFKIEGEFELNQALGKLGMTDAFEAQKADFSNMTSADKFCIDRVIHKTFIDVDEAGTEAAAITAVTMRMTAIFGGHHHPPVVFRADHPFLFLLRHQSSGAILFMGRVTDPR